MPRQLKAAAGDLLFGNRMTDRFAKPIRPFSRLDGFAHLIQ
jgi:hypothetical protein